MKRYATELIRKPRPQDNIDVGDVNTQGILETVLAADPKAAWYTGKFALTLKGNTVMATAENIWKFLKTRIPYVLDKNGFQWIKSPGKLWADKAGDCKSFSVFTASILRNLGIPYGYRFASYDPDNSDPTHVYIFIPAGKATAREIIIDAVWTGPFNTEKKYTSKKDYIMAKTFYLGSIGQTRHIPGVIDFNGKNIDELTDGEFDLILARQRLEIEKMNAAHAGMGSTRLAGYDESLKVVNHMLRNVDNPEIIEAMGDSFISGIGASKKKKGLGKFIKKVGQGIKKGAKAVAKVVSAPMRLMIQQLIKIQLPKASPMFLYLFTPPGAVLPTQVERKKKKAEKLKRVIVKMVGMKEDKFMALVRNNLTKRFKKSPESFLQEKLKARVSGHGSPRKKLIAMYGSIGAIPADQRRLLRPKVRQDYNTTFNEPYPADDQIGVWGTIISVVLQAIKWIIGLFKKNKKAGDEDPGEFTKDDVPDVEQDWVDAIDLPRMRNANAQAVMDELEAEDKAAAAPQKGKFLKKVANVFDNISDKQAQLITDIASGLLAKKSPKEVIVKTVTSQLSFLNQDQKNEVIRSVSEGGYAVDYDDGMQFGFDNKQYGMEYGPDGGPNIKNGGGARNGFCEC